MVADDSYVATFIGTTESVRVIFWFDRDKHLIKSELTDTGTAL